jgi:hypothetical protein
MTTHTKNLAPPRDGIHYKEHQVVGIRWMLDREREDAAWCRGGVLADDMGLGKTFQTIGLMKNGDPGMRTLIVCPPALVSGWTEELKACGYFVSTLFTGAAEWICHVTAAEKALPRVWLLTYPRLCMYIQTLMRDPAGPFDRVVLDEGHLIRNGFKTSRGMACLRIAHKASRRWILSATPVQNGVSDWIHLCQWLRVRCKKAVYPEAAADIMLRRTMTELRATSMTDLPPVPEFIIRDLTIPDTADEMEKEEEDTVAGVGTTGIARTQKKKTDSEYKYFHALCDQLDDVMDDRKVSALIKLELYMRIQQFLVHPQVYIEGRRAAGGFPRGDWTGGATKWAACVEGDLAEAVAEGAGGTIVFCQFRREMDMVVAAAEKMGADVWAIRGGMSVADVGAAVAGGRTAVEEGRPVVLVVQIVSGGVGLNLQFCSRVLFLSQHWNPAVVHQAVGRAVRIGQKEVVRVYMYRIVDDVMDNLDLRMSDVHAGKIVVARELCASFYEGFWGGSNGLTDIAVTVDGGSSPTEIAVERLSSDALSIDRASTGLLDNPGNSRPVVPTDDSSIATSVAAAVDDGVSVVEDPTS